ncbi:BON domain-containing protein [Paraburkholderia sacchari]|uniref:BON domain-containing protein n=1 Tax=Paraburkholderia sacchari TaxID=159450 RepID=UPI001BD1B4EA|nr:BON domain-containing protein [Paraburkholderia sacchari]
MNSGNALNITIGVLFAMMSAHAWAQGGHAATAPAAPTSASDSDSDSDSDSASSSMTSKSARQADRALNRRVYAALAKIKEVDSGNISVSSKNGAVTLNGTVTEAIQIDKVAEIAKGVPGVKSVTNKLIIRRPLGQ